MGPAQKASTSASASASGSKPSPSTMSTSAEYTPIEKLPLSIPRLEPNGSNWAIFQIRFRNAMKVTRRWAFFTGDKSCPVPADLAHPTSNETNAREKWEYDDSVASYQLSQCLPDTTVMRLSGCDTTKERWHAVSSEYQAKSSYAQADLHQTFLEMRCAKGEDVREFLSSLCILRGIPSELATFASHLLSSALIVYGATSINIDALINQINEEAERLNSRRARGNSGQGGKKESTTDEAFEATESKGGKKQRRKGDCHNCGKAGHWARECRSPKKEKDESEGTQAAQTSSTTQESENEPVGSANTATVYDFEGDGFWMAEEAVVPAPDVDMEPDPMLGASDVIDDAPHQEGEDMFLSEEEWFGVAIADVDEETDPRVDLQRPEPINLPTPNGAAEPHDKPVPEQIQAPTCRVERLSESLRGKETWRATGQDSQVSAHALEGKIPLKKVHGRPHSPHNLRDPYSRGSTGKEQSLVDPKALVRVHQMRRPVLDESAVVHIDPWPNAGTIHADPDIE